MRYIETLRQGDTVSDVYLCKSRITAYSKNGKAYDSLVLQDKTGVIDAKVWDLNSGAIGECEALDYIYVVGDVTSFQGKNQLNIKRIKKASEGEYIPADYLPVSRFDPEKMYEFLQKLIDSMKNPYLKQLSKSFFDNPDFAKDFKYHSAAKSVHHGFVGGLLEHTLNVTRICDFYSKLYPNLNRDLLITAAIFHDVGKLDELTTFPENDYTDAGNLLGHIMMGAMKIQNRINEIEGFPKKLGDELIHCILAHHGELEFGSPKKPALVEAVALSFADNSDAKLETFREAMSGVADNDLSWQGFNRYIDSNIRRTSLE